MRILFCILIGYLFGCPNPAALLSKLKKQDLRTQGSGNLGATNVLLVLGKGYGALVMVLDVAKAYIAVKIAQILFPTVAAAGVVAGGAAVVGHVYPFYLRFRGGKGLAAFAGLVLGVDPLLFLLLLAIALVLLFAVNHSVAVPLSAGVLFPLVYGLRGGGTLSTAVVTATSLLILYKHFSNIGKTMRGEDPKVREYVKTHLLHKGPAE